MKSGILNFQFKQLLVFVLLSYPLFYHSYKFSTPDFGGKDYFSYYRLYKDWDFKSVESPFNMRLISSGSIYLLHKTGIYYPAQIVFDNPDYDQRVFFSAILFNYLCVVFTCLVIYRTLMKFLEVEWLAWAGGVLYLLGFGTLFFELTPMADACGVLLFALMFHFYLARSRWYLVFLFLSIFQREYTFFVFGLVGVLDYLLDGKKRFYLEVALASVLCFVTYFVLRKTLFFTDHFSHQISMDKYSEAVFKWQFPILPYIRQSLLIQNILFLYFVLVAYKKVKGLGFSRNHFIITVALFVQINIISVVAVLGNNTGRYFYIATPLIIYYLIRELSGLPEFSKKA
jgi:hypothetical protein